MQFQLGDFVEPIYCPGTHRMVVDLNPEQTAVLEPAVVVAWRDHDGRPFETTVEAKYLRLVYRASGAPETRQAPPRSR